MHTAAVTMFSAPRPRECASTYTRLISFLAGKFMTTISSHRYMAVGCLIVITLLGAVHVARAEVGYGSTPNNAHARASGRGWECDRGYTEVSQDCVAVAVPANAYLEASGSTWRCDRGYQRDAAACVAIAVPSNAYLNDASNGSGWECNRGYREVEGRCQAITVPANAY